MLYNQCNSSFSHNSIIMRGKFIDKLTKSGKWSWHFLFILLQVQRSTMAIFLRSTPKLTPWFLHLDASFYTLLSCYPFLSLSLLSSLRVCFLLEKHQLCHCSSVNWSTHIMGYWCIKALFMNLGICISYLLFQLLVPSFEKLKQYNKAFL
jgi:hypothetical protein